MAGFLLEGLGVTAIGCLAGLVLSLSGDRLISNMLYGVTALDPETYGGVVVLILLVATMASLLPAWQSVLAEPAQALRQQ